MTDQRRERACSRTPGCLGGFGHDYDCSTMTELAALRAVAESARTVLATWVEGTISDPLLIDRLEALEGTLAGVPSSSAESQEKK